MERSGRWLKLQGLAWRSDVYKRQPQGSAERRPEGRAAVLGEAQQTAQAAAGRPIRVNPQAPLPDLNSLPFPYADLAGFENRIIYYESSRGCPSVSYTHLDVYKRQSRQCRAAA